jgi:hypothetical protein
MQEDGYYITLYFRVSEDIAAMVHFDLGMTEMQNGQYKEGYTFEELIRWAAIRV